MSLVREVTAEMFAFRPDDGTPLVWSRRVDRRWLADQLELEAMSAAATDTPAIRWARRAVEGGYTPNEVRAMLGRPIKPEPPAAEPRDLYRHPGASLIVELPRGYDPNREPRPIFLGRIRRCRP